MKANRNIASFSVASTMTGLVVKKRGNLSSKTRISNQNRSPITEDVAADTMVANLAPFPLPAPNSLEARTLQCATHYPLIACGYICRYLAIEIESNIV